MRNDARPIGEDAHTKSPIDDRDSVTHDRQSHIVNRDAEEHARRVNRGVQEIEHRVNRGAEDEDPTMPTGDSTLNTKI
jgi:hypothetical protein